MSAAAPQKSDRETGPTVNVLVFSDRPEIRAKVRRAVGRRPAADVSRINWLEAAHPDEIFTACEKGEVDLLVLDGEAQPTGGMGLSKQLRNELDVCPPVCLLIAREADRWLANWSRAEGVITQPIDPVRAAAVIADLVRSMRQPVHQ